MPTKEDCWVSWLKESRQHAGFLTFPSQLSGPSCTYLPSLAGISAAPADWPGIGKSLLLSQDPRRSFLGSSWLWKPLWLAPLHTSSVQGLMQDNQL